MRYFFIFLFIFFFGCTSSGTDDDFSLPSKPEQGGLDTDDDYGLIGQIENLDSIELHYNRNLLKENFYDAKVPIYSLEYYQNSGFSYVGNKPFADVHYMYSTLNDPFSAYYDSTCYTDIFDVLNEIVDSTVFVRYYSIGTDTIPLIKITEFSDYTSNEDGTYGEFLEALELTDDAPSTIIDLRGNSGGSIDQCIAVAEELLPLGDTAIISNERADTFYYVNHYEGLGLYRYYVFLTDAQTASCAEIMIAAVSSNRKSPVVGQLTFGKGLGQYYFTTPASGIAKISAMEFYDKDSFTFNRYGIEPDFSVANSNEALQKALELSQERTFMRNKKYGATQKSFSQDTEVLLKAQSRDHFIKGVKSGAYRIKKNKGSRITDKRLKG